MIRRLRLVNWRAYEELDLHLGEGTTFVVARNGIGKTSLIEGASWALYGGIAHRPTDAVRKGAKSASATVELVLPDQRILTITRAMPARLAKNAKVPMTALLDDEPIHEDDAQQLLTSSLAGEPPFLARLTMIQPLSGAQSDPASLDLAHNLSRVFGIDGLHDVQAELDRRRKTLVREIAEARESEPVSAATLRQLEADAIRVDDEVARLAEAHDRAVREEKSAEAALRAVDAFAEWTAQQQERTRQLEALAIEAGLPAATLRNLRSAHRAGTTDLADGLRGLWEREQQDLESRLETNRVRAGVLEAQIKTLTASLAELDTASGQCPVCRRPLSTEDKAAARAEHERELADLRSEASRIDTAALSDALVQTRARLRTLGLHAHRREPPEQLDLDREHAIRRVETATAARSEALDLLVEGRTRAANARSAFTQASADNADRERLATLYEQQAKVAAATKAVAAAVKTLMTRTVSPLEQELASRWKMLFSDRGGVRLESGDIVREINGHDLPFAAFSDGEKASAQILLRLLVLDAATRANFCWIDEPLEHLDPITRRHIGSMLARAGTTSGTRQVLVTTYEEPLARRLALRFPANTHLVYVRPGSGTDS
jgi:DNA repair exonuclease SbcCD ATPase subunit